MFTTHGHFIYGSPHTPHEERPRLVLCGGPAACQECAFEESAYNQSLLGSPAPAAETPKEVEMSVPSTRSVVQRLYEVVDSLDALIANVERQAQENNVDPIQLMTMNGEFVLAPLLVAKANALSALTTLGER